jgi:hypothetical protein
MKVHDPTPLSIHLQFIILVSDFLSFVDNPACERCLQENESATHILCDCEAVVYLRYRHLGQFVIEPSDFYDAPVNEVLHFIRSVGLVQKGSTIDH